MAIRMAINGFGRIGRSILRAAIEADYNDIEFVAANDLTDTNTLAHLLKYDSVHGTAGFEVSTQGNQIKASNHCIEIFDERDPSRLPWKKLEVDIVLECTGYFRTRQGAGLHLDAGAKRVLISAPAKNDVDFTAVYGVNHTDFDPKKHLVVSNASCTTNCLSPMVRTVIDNFGLEHGLMTTVHSYTNDQSILDLPHTDLRRARAAAISMIPTTTGAAQAVSLVIPEVKGKLDGLAVRVPTPNVSLTDLTATVTKKVSVEAVNEAFRDAANGSLSEILHYSKDPLVSIDYRHDPHSCIFDAPLTRVAGNMIKIFGWYDNEWGFSSRMIDMARYIMNQST